METVLSTDKYRRLVVAAKSLQFEVRLTYVILATPEQNIERVRLRVAKGGHDVARDRIVARYARSQLIGQKRAGIIVLDPDALPQIVKAVEKITAD